MSRRALLLGTALVLITGVLGVGLLVGNGTADTSATVFGEGDLDAAVQDAAPFDSPEPQVAPLRSAVEPRGPEGVSPARRAGLRIRGRVLDRQGLPLPGAVVRMALRTHEGSTGSSSILRVRQPETTASDGRFAFEGPSGGAFGITVEVRAAGHAPLGSDHDLGSTPSEPIDLGDLRLVAGGQITGLVLDAAGHGLAGATVVLQPNSANPLVRASDLPVLLLPVATDASGGYRFTNLSPGGYRVRASASGMQKANAPTVQVTDGIESRVEPIRLAAGVELVGIVLGQGDSVIAGALVRARGERATSGQDGRFRIEHLPPANLSIEVRASGFLSWQRADVDPTKELVVQLETGLCVAGVVTDAESGAPVQAFAAKVRRVRSLQPGDQGELDLAEQLRRRAESLRASALRAATAEGRARDEAVAAELEARIQAVASGTSRHLRVPADVGPAVARAEGKFRFEGLDEGVYVVDVLSPVHRFSRTAALELRRGTPCPELRIAVERASLVRGVVQSRGEGEPILGALVELVRVSEAPAPALRAGSESSTFAWAAARQAPPGDIVHAVRSDGRGRFEILHADAGRYYVSARHPSFVGACTAVFELSETREGLVLALCAPASVRGRVHGVPAGSEGRARVLAVGGAATMRSAFVGTDGSYRLESLEPGTYLVGAFLGDAAEASEEQVRAFLATKAKAGRHDLTLVEGERRDFDLRLEVPPVGSVRGTVTINGAPSGACRVELHSPVATRALNAVPDARGEYLIGEVQAGEYTLRVTVAGNNRQELHREVIAVVADQTTPVHPNLACGGLRGRVVAGDGTPDAQIEGTVLVLPGALTMPLDLREYARKNRVHELRVRGGAFAAEHLTAGPGRAVVQIRGRQQVDVAVEVVARSVRDVQLPAGVVR